MNADYVKQRAEKLYQEYFSTLQKLYEVRAKKPRKPSLMEIQPLTKLIEEYQAKISILGIVLGIEEETQEKLLDMHFTELILKNKEL